MAEIFESYEEEFRSLASHCQKHLSDLVTYETNRDKKLALLQQATPQIAQLEGIIKQMKVEVRSQEPATKATLSIKVQSYEKALAGMKSDLGKAREREEKDALFGGGGAGVGGTGAMAQRQRLLETNERLANQNRTIENARKVMAETELVGIQIGEELDSNREKIQNIRGKVREVQGLAGQAKKLVKDMGKRWF